MRLVVPLILLCILVASAIFAFTVVTDPAKTYGFFASLSGSETLEKRPLIAFVPMKGDYRISFPASKPGELSELTKYTRQTPLPSPQYFVGDREVGFFSTAYTVDLSGVSSAFKSTMTDYYLVTPTSSVTPAQLNTSAVTTYDPVQIQNFLDTKCDDIIKNVGGTISNKYPDNMRGGLFPGRDLEGTFKNTQNAFRMRLFLDQKAKRIVAVAVVGKPKRVFSAQATKFLKSLDMW